MPTTPPPDHDVPPLAAALLLGLAVAQIWIFVLLIAGNEAFRDAAGRPVPTDFALFWSAGRAAWDGQAAAFYDPAVAKAAQVAAVGRDFPGVFRWNYPPFAFLATLPLPILPVVAAQAFATLIGFGLFAWAMFRLAGMTGLVLAVAWPGTLACATVGQGGFLLGAAVTAGGLLSATRPIRAGALLGCLALKPHLGLMVPFALFPPPGRASLVAGAAGVVALLGLASLPVVGPAAWAAFVEAGPTASQGLLGDGVMGFGKLQSVYGAVRFAGGSALLAGLLQGGAAVAAAALVWRVWSRSADGRMRAASFGTAAALATPYLYLYDLPILAPAVACLLGGADRRTGFALAAVFLSLAIHPAGPWPTAAAAAPILFGLLWLRVSDPTRSIEDLDMPHRKQD